ncbi:hypothetical protein SteCoe_5342 [Stentor coeruleus]|uniref:Uncharacterized protein n=1 Tax=Stentor coeruleus TaxID=5963 RepID=A0A1R2CSS7_9CILI|nr:hypothetical protein SteCoe_5342 [Stentor coeruleus]
MNIPIIPTALEKTISISQDDMEYINLAKSLYKSQSQTSEKLESLKRIIKILKKKINLSPSKNTIWDFPISHPLSQILPSETATLQSLTQEGFKILELKKTLHNLINKNKEFITILSELKYLHMKKTEKILSYRSAMLRIKRKIACVNKKNSEIKEKILKIHRSEGTLKTLEKQKQLRDLQKTPTEETCRKLLLKTALQKHKSPEPQAFSTPTHRRTKKKRENQEAELPLVHEKTQERCVPEILRRFSLENISEIPKLTDSFSDITQDLLPYLACGNYVNLNTP